MGNDIINIWNDAKKAKSILIDDRTRGEREFDVLLSDHPRDGMIYFQRAEAYEAIGDLDLALSDFRAAEQLIFNTKKVKWKEVARERAKRVADAEEQVIKRVLDTVPHDLMKGIQQALDMKFEPQGSLLGCCTALEAIVENLAIAGKLEFRGSQILAEKIKMLRDAGVIENATASHMHTIRVLRNGAAHGESMLREDADVSRSALRAILRRVFSHS